MNKFRGQNGYNNSSTNRSNNRPVASVSASTPAASERKPDIRPTAQEIVDHANAKPKIEVPAASEASVQTARSKPQTERSDGNVNT